MSRYNTLALSNRELAQYLSGYVDGEGCFSVSVTKRPKLRIGWEIKPSFSVGQNFDRREVLDVLHQYFGCGHIRRDWHDKTLKYEVRKAEDLAQKIIPHFQRFPLLSAKQKDFLLFAEVCASMSKGKHHSKAGLRRILRLAYRMNGSGKRKFPLGHILKTLER